MMVRSFLYGAVTRYLTGDIYTDMEVDEEVLPPIEESEEQPAAPDVFIPGVHQLGKDEILEPDESVYIMRHSMNVRTCCSVKYDGRFEAIMRVEADAVRVRARFSFGGVRTLLVRGSLSVGFMGEAQGSIVLGHVVDQWSAFM